jgi:S1-C subfamily serine protease
VLHFFTGTHPDYHRPSDDAPKVNIEGMRRVTDMLSQIVQATDAAEQRPTYLEIKRIESIAMSGGGDRPSFGSMPAYPNPVEDGVLLEAVLEGSAAEKAGVKAGDVLIKLGESRIMTLEDFEGALRKHKPGDKLKVVIRRGIEAKEETELEVTLGSRRQR